MSLNLQKKITQYTDFTGDCWLWVGHTDKDGYARLTFKRKDYRVQRLMYVLCRGDLPRELVVDHLCRVRNCVNPYHFEAVTNRINIQRGKRATATTCLRGHAYTADNLYHDRSGHRICKTCILDDGKKRMSDPTKRAQKNSYKRRWRATKRAQEGN